MSPDPRGHPTRERVYNAVVEKPGRTFLDLVRTLGFTSYGQAQYHLYVLERFGHIHHVKAGRSVHYYPTSGTTPQEAEADAMAFTEVRRRILDCVREEPGVNMTGIAARLGFTRQNVAYHARRMEPAGLVRVEARGMSRVVRVADRSGDAGPPGCLDCRRGPCNAALMPGEACSHGCGCYGSQAVPA